MVARSIPSEPETISESFICLDYMQEFYGENKFDRMKAEYSAYVKDITVKYEKAKVVFYKVPNWEEVKFIFQ